MKQALAAISAGDADAFSALFSDDYVLELPSIRPEPIRVEGKAAATESVRQSFQTLRIKMTLVEVHELANGDLIAEYKGDTTIIPTGRQLKNEYVGIWRFADGKITFTREYYDTEVGAQVRAELGF